MAHFPLPRAASPASFLTVEEYEVRDAPIKANRGPPTTKPRHAPTTALAARTVASSTGNGLVMTSSCSDPKGVKNYY